MKDINFRSVNDSFERSENVLYAVAPLTGGKIQNAIWPKIWMLIFILGQNKSKQAKKNFDPARPGLTLIKRLLLGRYGTEDAEILQVCSPT